MDIARDGQSVVSSGRRGVPRLGLLLSTLTCAAGGRLSGVVVFQLAKPTGIRSLTVSLSGRETPAGASVARSLRRTTSFFHREALLSGMDQPRFTQERVSQLWNAFLARDRGTTLSPGEHTYPFSIPLPASLPPSYGGRAGTIAYTVTVRAHFPTGGALRITKDVAVLAVPRRHRTHPIALTYPDSSGAVSPNEVSVNVELPGRAVAQGERICGRISVANPRQQPIRRISILLENCEWVRLASERELQRNKADERIIEPDQPDAAAIESDFELQVPADGPPTVEGTTISVIWLLRMILDTDPSVELKTPLFVYSPP